MTTQLELSNGEFLVGQEVMFYGKKATIKSSLKAGKVSYCLDVNGKEIWTDEFTLKHKDMVKQGER